MRQILIVLAVLALLSASANAQSKSVEGTVTELHDGGDFKGLSVNVGKSLPRGNYVADGSKSFFVFTTASRGCRTPKCTSAIHYRAPKIEGSISKVGQRIRVHYSRIDDEHGFGWILRATKIVQITDTGGASSNVRSVATNGDVTQIPNDLFPELMRVARKACGDSIPDYYSSERDFANKSFETKSVALDSRPSIIVSASGPCFGARGIQVWIYRKAGSRWQQLLDNWGSEQVVTIGKKLTNGLRDITIDVGSFRERVLTTYKFDGSKYVGTKDCVHKLFGYVDNGGNWREYKVPKIKRDCSFDY